MQGAVTVRMNTDADTVWKLLTDVTRIGELSPETFEAEWLDGATGPAVGARFRGHVKRNGIGPVYWTTCDITDCEPGRSFGFAVVHNGRTLNTWRYAIAPATGGVDVTESFELPTTPASRIYWAIAGWRRGRRNEQGMRQTLERAKAIVEA